MFGQKKLKGALFSTTALIAAAMVFPAALTAPTPALAVSIDGTTQLSAVTLGTGDSLTVENNGTLLSTGAPSVTVNGAATYITTDNSPGTINTSSGGTTTAILVTGTGSDLTGGIINNGQLVASGNVIRVENGGHISGDIVNNFAFGNTLQSNKTDTIVVTGSGSDISGLFDNMTPISSGGGSAFLVTSGGQMSGGIKNHAGIGISGVGSAITVSGAGSDIGGVGIDNLGGPISGTTAAVVVSSGGDISGGIYNNSDMYSSSDHTGGIIQVSGAGSDISGGINNAGSGHLTGNDYAITVKSGGAISGGITNSGSITGNSSAILIDHGSIGNGVYSGIVNSGTISSSQNAISVTASTITGGISNTGSITGDNIGINITNSSTVGNILNDTGGTLTGGSTAIYINNSQSGTLTNKGTLSGNTAISLKNNGKVAGNITNTGSIIGIANGISLSTSSSVTGSISNTGSITSGGAGHSGILISTTSTVSGSVGNGVSGQITGGQYGVQISSGATVGSILNDTSAVMSGSANAILIDNGQSGSITNNGTLSGQTAILIENGGSVTNNITNTGIINYPSVNGISVGSGASVNGSIINSSSGTIGAGVNAINIDGGATIGGSISNSNLLKSGATHDGIFVSGAATQISGSIVNNTSGTISNGSNGIHIKSSATVSGNISNSGTIKASSAGINVENATVTGDVRNETGSSILSTGGNGIVVQSSASVGNILNDTAALITSTKENISITGGASLTGSLTNNGTLSGGTKGISLTNGSTIASGIDNSGTISASKTGIYVYGSAIISTNGINNSGNIIGSGAGGTKGINIYGGVDVTGNVLNSGLISNEATGISLGGSGSLTGDIKNTGTIKNGGVGIEAASSSTLGNILNDTGALISTTKQNIFVHSAAEASGSLTNNGTLTGGTIGIQISSGGAIDTILSNGGTINASETGIKFNNGGEVNGALINTTAGSIIAGTYGIYMSTGGKVQSLNNSGTISANTGVFLDTGGSITGTLTNSGLITGTSGHGLKIHSATIDKIDNAAGGTIKGSSYGIDISNANTLANGIVNEAGAVISGSLGMSVSSSTVSGDVINSGTIKGDDAIHLDQATVKSLTNNTGGSIKGTSGTGIILTNTSVITNGITNKTGATISGTYSGIDASKSDLSLTNTGTISGSTFAGINQYQSTLDLTNNSGGTISSGANGIVLDSSSISSNSSVANSGLITGNLGISVKNSSGTAQAGYTDIINSSTGTIEGTGGTAIDMNITNSTVGAKLHINGGHIIGDVTDENAATDGVDTSTVTIGGDFATEGNFTVDSFVQNSGTKLTVSAGNNISAADALSLNAGTVVIGVNGTSDFGSFTSLSATDITGTTFKADVASSPSLTDGDTLKIIDGANNIVGGPGDTTPLTITDNSLLWNFSIVEGSYNSLSDDTDLYLLVSASSSGGCSGTTNTPGNTSACTVLLANSSTSDPQLQQVLSNINSASTTQQLNNLLSSTQPGVNGGFILQSMLTGNTALGMNQNRLNQLHNGGKTGAASGNSLKEGITGLHGWVQTFGDTAHQGTRDNIGGYDANTLGLSAGVDSGQNLDGKVIGFAFSYGHSNINANNANNTDTHVNSYQLSGYGSYDLPENSYLQGMAALTWHNITNLRHDVGGVAGLNAKGDFNAYQINLTGKYARDFKYKNTIITPALTANFTNYNAQSYTETGAGGANLHVDYKNLNVLQVGPEIAARWKHAYTDGSYIIPQLTMGYSYDLIGDNIQADSSFTGGTGTVASTGPRPARGTLNLGAKATLYTANDWEVSADYDFDYKSQYTAHSGVLRIGHKF